MNPLSLEAPAKLNLSLRVVGRREDGFHLLETEMVLLELADRLLLMPGAPGLRVEAGPDAPRLDAAIPLDPRNLAWRGLVAGQGREPDSLCLALDKRIPTAAGLGGGSSDAAAGWRLGRVAAGRPEVATDADLVALATIGADVPFFAARCAAAAVAGVGERVTPIDAPERLRHVVLVFPGFRLSTAEVFAELRPADLGHPDPAPGHNDLLAPALRLRPALAEVMRRVAHAGAEPRLTGSGSTLFVLGDDPEQAAGVAAQLRGDGLHVTETRLRSEAASVAELTDPPNDAGASRLGMG
ncbi:MAG TPA: 4-(cytidine 5'-diphospho)-2-C-methyl-D-erythritol kinase [Candidatus Limnocylindria bacterium]|nr:4-(cytidine 5'-diphospho)-2-C-methyl-D-erythritol kinase [Candidatus Limnocylindria bacterium]